MRSTLALAAVIGLVLSSCASAGLASGTPDASAIPTTEPTSSPLPTATTTPTATPEATATPFGAAVFADPDECTNPHGYRVAYPDDWYSNAAVANPFDPAGEGVAACQYFAPRNFATAYGTEPSPDVAISIHAWKLGEGEAWGFGPFDGYTILTDTQVSIGGYPARRQVLEVTHPNIGFVAAGERLTAYTIELGENRYVHAETINSRDYPASRQVLADMMRTLEVVPE